MEYNKHDLEEYISVIQKWNDFEEWINAGKPKYW